ncbi:MAG: hypothetical protein LBJ35_00205 [Spirochaetaceae bacterium]|nr:hypothetical protein [Spirochaetaceae bacterium]
MFEKRIAIPNKIWYETDVDSSAGGNEDGGSTEEKTEETTDADGETKTVHFTTNKENKKEGGLIIGEDYKLAEKYSIGETSEVTQNPLVPVFTREHYKSSDWKDMTGKSVTPDAN